MFRLALIAAFAALLSACATLAPSAPNLGAPYVRFDDEAPIEPPVFNRVARNSLGALDRRSFSPPLRRQPELRVTTVTVVDRLRRRGLHRVRRRA